jgi:protein TonB
MKKYLFLLLLAQGTVLYAQREYLDENKFPLADSAEAKFYRIKQADNKSGSYSELCFYISGEKESETPMIFSSFMEKYVQSGKCCSWYKNGQLKNEVNYLKGILNGKELIYYENGQVKTERNYSDNKLDKELVTYWKNGTKKREDRFNNGKFEKGICYDSLGNKIKHFDYQIRPHYKGGESKMLSDIASGLKYPINSKNAGIEGRVYVRIAINSDGTILRLDILSGINRELDWEAMRVIRTLKKFEPAYEDGEPVVFYYAVPITFTLE